MKQFLGGRLTWPAILVMLSLLLLTACQLRRGNPPPNEPALCPSSAFIEEKEYEIPPLLSKDDRDFHLWVGENYAPKYPLLKNAYSDLLECWLHYHPKEKPRP